MARLFCVSLIILFAGLSSSYGETVRRPYGIYHFDRESIVEQADSAIVRAREQLVSLLGRRLSYTPDIYLAETKAEFDSLVGGSFPDWGAAVAIPYKRRIVLKAPWAFNLGKSFDELLAHEYSHLALDDRLGLGSAPRWFNEGLAMYVSMEWGWSDNFTLNRAAVFGSLLPLDDVQGLNRMEKSVAELAYAESYIAVKYLYDTYGAESVNQFLDVLVDGKSTDSALTAGFGATEKEFEAEFASHLRERYNLVTLLADMVYFWIGLAVLVVVGAFMKYRGRRHYYRKWQEQERLQSTDFDFGDPDNPEQIDDDEPWRS